MTKQFEFAATTPRGEAREKYLRLEVRKLFCFAQQRLTAIGAAGSDRGADEAGASMRSGCCVKGT
jgi:hypothetical protein